MRLLAFDARDFETLRDIVSRLGLADVKAFGMTWEDCEGFLSRLGYRVSVRILEVRRWHQGPNFREKWRVWSPNPSLK